MIEVNETLWRRCKSQAALYHVSLIELLDEALTEKVDKLEALGATKK